ncbi:AraC family transcriptional regulator [Antrihabitans sp. YC2-6]|uniref:AraC family transcriptional regulator n=1 Tax=Antrihabitans sp. YC2-6 TaxID=2799498 RepID=UPI0018F57028|nr:AraC family transcriptional regulator [Antrihabitans sp. YC2-6]MBJ8344154.1 AraC family transcriptional regulator [Antrihabitans sp. YC2-6]
MVDPVPLVPAPGVLDWDFPRSIASIALLTAFAAERGVSADAMLRNSGVTPADLDRPDVQVDARAELVVVRNLLDAIGQAPGLGVEVGLRYHVTTFGIFGFAMVSSPTLGDAIALALRNLELSFTFCIPVAAIAGDDTVTHLHDERVPEDVRQFLLERDASAMHSVMRDLRGGVALPLQRMDFRFPEPPDSAVFLQGFGVIPRFGQPANIFTFPTAEMNQPLPQANSTTWAMCQAQCRDLIERRRSRTGIAHDVRDKLIRLGGAPAGIDEVAAELNLSTRTLRRRLTDAGTSYRDLLDEVREMLAEEMLSTTPMSVSDIAVSLGYAEASTFIYAFKRWKGTTPAAYQRDRRTA